MKKISTKLLTAFAMNSAPLSDALFTRHFIDENEDADIPLETKEYGATWVQLVPVGKFRGTNSETSKPVDEIIDNKALAAIIANDTEGQYLVDIDHKSMRDPMDRTTEAAGWVSNLVQVPEPSPLAGIWGKIKWTSVGKQLVEDKTYRFLSPVLQLNDDGRPYKFIMTSLTNRPAMKSMDPILNTSPIATQEDISKEYIDMTKEELIDIVNGCIDEKMKALNACGETKEEVENSEVEEKTEEVTEAKEETVEETVEEVVEKVEEKTEDKAEATESKEDKEDDAEEVEVIKTEVLNSTPALVESKIDSWKNLRGNDFVKWLEAHPRGI